MNVQHPRDIALAQDIAEAVKKANRPLYYAMGILTVLNVIVLAVTWSRSGGAEAKIASTATELQASAQQVAAAAESVKTAAAVTESASKAMGASLGEVPNLQSAITGLNDANASLLSTAALMRGRAMRMGDTTPDK